MVIESPTLALSIISSIGIALILVEKKEDFPISGIHKLLSYLIEKTLGLKWALMLHCTVCTSFWASLLVEISLYFITDRNHFLWPLTGFATAGIAYLIIDVLNILDRRDT
jgi:hypothetical protein